MANHKKRKQKQRRQKLREERQVVGTKKEHEPSVHLSLQAPSRSTWAGPNRPVGAYIANESLKTLEAYRVQPNLVMEHANHEEDTARGGYAHRQLFELVQNSADSLAASGTGRIWIKLTSTNLYCADEGQPVDASGVRALMFSHLSSKRGTTEIGRFGLGFKSVLGVTDTPEFFSRSGSFRFDRGKAVEHIQAVAPTAERYPVLRLPEAIDPWPEMESDPILRELMAWAANIVRLPLKRESHQGLSSQIRDFPPEFLLFVGHVSELVLQDESRGDSRTFRLRREDDLLILDDGSSATRWRLTQAVHHLSPDARSDSRSLDDEGEVPIWWAAPVDRLNEPGKFWAFFPTMTTSLLAGILNAPWKTNEDRQNLLPGVYNDELVEAAAAIVTANLSQLSIDDDPARHLDALPRRWEAGDPDHSRQLRDHLYANLQARDFVPDQDGALRQLADMSYPPRELTRDGQTSWESLDRWSTYTSRPSAWLHYSALNRNRLATLERVLGRQLSRASIADWLRALVKSPSTAADALQASIVAVQTAALIPKSIRGTYKSLGNIVLAADGRWVEPNPDTLFLGGDSTSTAANLVHPQLQLDPETLDALKTLGLQPASAESAFRELASDLLDVPWYESRVVSNEEWHRFWRLARSVDQQEAETIIATSTRRSGNWRDKLCVRTISGKWRSLFQTLLPGRIVPLDGSRDDDFSIDVQYHAPDLPLLSKLGATDVPRARHELSLARSQEFSNRCKEMFQDRAKNTIGRRPQDNLLRFENSQTAGPLDLLELLSEESKALYTWNLLSLDDTYKQWTMRHSTQDIYPRMEFESPVIEVLRQHGRIETSSGIYPLSDGLGNPPGRQVVLFKLLSHPKAAWIRQVFELQAESESPTEPIGADAPVPLLDAWVGLKTHVATEQASIDLVRCDGFQTFPDGARGPR